MYFIITLYSLVFNYGYHYNWLADFQKCKNNHHHLYLSNLENIPTSFNYHKLHHSSIRIDRE